MAMAMGGGSGPRFEMNVTPLIDVLLVLIIIFMIMPHRSRGEEAEAPQPQPPTETKPEPTSRTIVIELEFTGDGQRPNLKINQDEVAWDALEQRLKDIYKLRAEKVAFLRGNKNVDFEYVADVMDMARSAQIDRVGLLPAEK